MSKINELRRRASKAVRDRQYDQAIDLYGKICSLDPANGSPRNELGDLYLKTDRSTEAIDCFSVAASLYRDFGLTNNAVAVLKKILRHDPNHLDSIWLLAEVRRDQHIDAEASAGYLAFLSRAESVPEQGREAFFERASSLLTTMADDMEILSRLDEIYRKFDRLEDVAAVLIAKAWQAHIEEEFDVRDRYLAHAHEATELCDSLPAYHDYLARVEEADRDPDDPGEEGVIDLSEDIDEEVSFADVAEGDDGSDSGSGGGRTVVLNVDDVEIDLSSAESLDLGFDIDEEQLSKSIGVIKPVPVQAEPVEATTDELPTEEPAAEEQDAAELAAAAELLDVPDPEGADSVNLLAEILADGSFDAEEHRQQQMDTIAAEMRGQIAGEVEATDAPGQYELGIVYMDIGLFDQAIEAFRLAAGDENHRLGSLEMIGTCLLRLGRDEDAMAAFQEGLGIPGQPGKAYLGLLYGVGSCHELRGELAEACDYFERVSAVDRGFLDVAVRIERLSETS